MSRLYDTILREPCGCKIVALRPKIVGGTVKQNMFGREMTKVPCVVHDYSLGRPYRLMQHGVIPDQPWEHVEQMTPKELEKYWGVNRKKYRWGSKEKKQFGLDNPTMVFLPNLPKKKTVKVTKRIFPKLIT